MKMTIPAPASPEVQNLKFELLAAKSQPYCSIACHLLGKLGKIQAAHLHSAVKFKYPRFVGGTISSEHLEDHRNRS